MIFINHIEELDGKIIVVEIKGALNNETSSDFEEYINQILDNNNIFIILDAESLEYISSSGIGVILYIQKKILYNKGYFVVCNISEEISTLYELLGFSKIIKIVDNRDEAIQIIEKQIDLIGNAEIEQHEELEIKGLDKGESSINISKNRFEFDSQESNETEFGDAGEEEKVFDDPIILECADCKRMIRVKKSGNYICPDCKTEFLVESDQTVVF